MLLVTSIQGFGASGFELPEHKGWTSHDAHPFFVRGVSNLRRAPNWLLMITRIELNSDMTEAQSTLRVENVTKRFGDFTAVEGLSFDVRAGRVFGFLGPNGAGKTTTIRMIVGITAPDEGRIELFGEPMSSKLQDRIGYLPEERGLYKKMKIVDQLRYFAALKGRTGLSCR